MSSADPMSDDEPQASSSQHDKTNKETSSLASKFAQYAALLPSNTSSSSSKDQQQFVVCGDTIQAEPGCLMGHGTLLVEGRLQATVSGFVERVNKLISVRPLQSRYSGEIGDVVVGRIVDLGDKRWKVDVGGRQNAVLLLSSVNLPGGVQRRRTQEDSLQMRNFFAEGDLISAEVQKIRHDGGISLHTRNLKYGKLSNGQFIRVPSHLIKRCKLHFQQLPCNITVILGLNGYIFISETPDESQTEERKEKDADQGLQSAVPPVTASGRERVCRVRNSILALAQMFIGIYHLTIMDVYLESVALGLPAKDILHPSNLTRVTQKAMERKHSAVA